MSYILDALRRADAERERERGSVPGLHTQSLPMMPGDDAPPRPLRLWLAAGVTALVLATLAWLLLGRDSLPADGVAAAPTVPGGAAMSSGAPVAAVAAGPVVIEPAPVPSTPALVVKAAPAPPMVVAAAGATATPAAPTAPAATPVAPAIKTLPAPVAVASAARKASGSALAPTAAASASAMARAPAKPAAKAPPVAGASASSTSPVASAPEGRIYTLAELPDEVRRDLPPLVIGGAMYSENPANRMLIVNGQLFHEGDKLAAGLQLEQIKLKSAVLRLKGYRYGITY